MPTTSAHSSKGFVVSELAKQQGWTENEFQMFHWRDRTGLEVDVVLEFDDGRVLGVEVTRQAPVPPR